MLRVTLPSNLSNHVQGVRMITKWSRIRAMSALVFLAAQLSQAQAVDYSVIPLGGTSSQAYGINESGQVVDRKSGG